MKRILVLAIALTCNWATSSLLRAGDWPGWRGPQRTDVSTESGLLKSWGDKGPTQLWSYDNAGLGYGGPAIVGKQMFLLGTRKESEVLIAIDVANGKERWATPIGSILNNGWGNGPRSTPTVA
ncbi:MAG TPA: polyvinylalcohol dehydrogenase, partial [Planctomycetaceae bacterium]|nr:polyvinylalcohol dehydrogenase [Planctomycetaceae bacterium]